MTEVLVLCYHAVSRSWDEPLSLTPDLIERQLTMLVRRGWKGATFIQAVFDPPTPRTLAVTFDDGFASVVKQAHPILSSLGLPATVFVPTAFVSDGRRLSWPGLDRRQPGASEHELEPMSWNDLGLLAEAGWEVGSHSRTHPPLTTLHGQSLNEELDQSRQEIQAALGRRCEAISYPYGDVDDRIAEAARAVGYRAGAALASRLTPAGPYRWPRIGVNRLDQMWRFHLKVNRSIRRLRATRMWPEVIGSAQPPTRAAQS